MPARNEDLHGMVPDKSSVALILLDVINALDFEGSEQLLEQVGPMAQNIGALKKKAKKANIPVVYVNDNYGRWQSDFNKLIEHCLRPEAPGRFMVEMLRPGEDDYSVIKPKHSGFFSTTLDVLLDYLNVRTLIITGVAGNICVLFTANDAYMRDFNIVVPADCTASNTREDNEHALRQIATVLKGDTTPSHKLDLETLKRRAHDSGQAPNPEPPTQQAATRRRS